MALKAGNNELNKQQRRHPAPIEFVVSRASSYRPHNIRLKFPLNSIKRRTTTSTQQKKLVMDPHPTPLHTSNDGDLHNSTNDQGGEDGSHPDGIILVSIRSTSSTSSICTAAVEGDDITNDNEDRAVLLTSSTPTTADTTTLSTIIIKDDDIEPTDHENINAPAVTIHNSNIIMTNYNHDDDGDDNDENDDDDDDDNKKNNNDIDDDDDNNVDNVATTTTTTTTNDDNEDDNDDDNDHDHHDDCGQHEQLLSEFERITELRSILPDASEEQLVSILRENDRASQITRQSIDDAIFAATATFADETAVEDAAAFAARESRTSSASSSSQGGGNDGRLSVASIDSRPRRSWSQCRPPTGLTPGVYRGTSHHYSGSSIHSGSHSDITNHSDSNNSNNNKNNNNDGIMEYDIGTTDADELEVKRIEIVSQLQQDLTLQIGYNLAESGKYDEMERLYQEGEKLLSSSPSSSMANTTNNDINGNNNSNTEVAAGEGAPISEGGSMPTEGASSATRERNAVLPTMMMWNAPPLSGSTLMNREPELRGLSYSLPLPPYLGGQSNNHENSNNKLGSTCSPGNKHSEICMGTIIMTKTEKHINNNAHEQKTEETGDTDDNSANFDTSLLGPYEVAIRCPKCRIIMQVQIDVGLVACPKCRTIYPTTDYAKHR